MIAATTPAEPPTCQWCRQTIHGTPAWWDGQPQCGNPHACDKRTTDHCHRKADR